MIRAGQISAFYLFDIADAIDLNRVAQLLGGAAQATQLAPKPATPAYVRYQVPPLQIDGAAVQAGELQGYHVRLKLFDYGVVSLALSRPISGDWPDFIAIADHMTSDAGLETEAAQVCRRLAERIAAALDKPRQTFQSEDYFVFAISALDPPLTADALLEEQGDAIAQLLRGETAPLSAQERDEVLRHRLSYLANDLVVPTWSAALVYDTPAGIHAAFEILEFANSQLLQFRYYDDLLDDRLSRLYKELESTGNFRWWWPHRYTRPAREVHALFIDVNELTDRTENALKLVGDVYAARLLALAHSRLGVTAWRESVQEKLKTLDGIYRFAVDQTAMERGEVLEFAIVAILVFELVLFFLGIMK